MAMGWVLQPPAVVGSRPGHAQSAQALRCTSLRQFTGPRSPLHTSGTLASQRRHLAIVNAAATLDLEALEKAAAAEDDDGAEYVVQPEKPRDKPRSRRYKEAAAKV
jgi:hypothetical protein